MEKKKFIFIIILGSIILIALLIFSSLYFFARLNSNGEQKSVLDEVKSKICLYTTRNPDNIKDDDFMVQYNTNLSESEIANHILKMGFNYSSIKITNDFYLILMNNEKIQRETLSYHINEATDAEFTKFAEYILNHSYLVTLAIRNPKGIMAMKVEFQREVPSNISKEILDKIILDYNNSEVWINEYPYYFNERKSWAHIIIPEGSGITEVEGYCKFIMEEEVIVAQLLPDRIYLS